jgi:non-ribosomal peptide synthetase component F
MSNEEIVAKEIRIERVYPEDLQSHFVSNIVVQHQPGIFILSFFEVWPPAILGESDEEKKQVIDTIDHVEAKCVARLVLTPSKMREFLETMSENLHNYEHMMQIQSEWDQD